MISYWNFIVSVSWFFSNSGSKYFEIGSSTLLFRDFIFEDFDLLLGFPSKTSFGSMKLLLSGTLGVLIKSVVAFALLMKSASCLKLSSNNWIILILIYFSFKKSFVIFTFFSCVSLFSLYMIDVTVKVDIPYRGHLLIAHNFGR